MRLLSAVVQRDNSKADREPMGGLRCSNLSSYLLSKGDELGEMEGIMGY